MHSFLIIKTSAIGDVIQTFIIAEYLKERFPACHITWVVEKGCHKLLSSHPLIDEAIAIDTKAWRKAPFSLKTRQEFMALVRNLRSKTYDVLFDLQGNSKSAIITGIAKAKKKVGFGFKSVPEKPNLLVTTERFNVPSSINVRARYLTVVQKALKDDIPFTASGISLNISEEEAVRLSNLLQEKTLSKPLKLMVAFGSKWRNKQLSDKTLEELLQLVDQAYQPSFMFIFSNEEEKRQAERLRSLFPANSETVGNMSLPFWQALMASIDGVIAMDSAALHLCGSTPTPSFSVFGPSSSMIYKPIEDKHVAYQGSCPYDKTFEKRCALLRSCKTGACMRELKAADLFDSFNRWCENFLAKRS